jgi:hypothetical protein
LLIAKKFFFLSNVLIIVGRFRKIREGRDIPR